MTQPQFLQLVPTDGLALPSKCALAQFCSWNALQRLPIVICSKTFKSWTTKQTAGIANLCQKTNPNPTTTTQTNKNQHTPPTSANCQSPRGYTAALCWTRHKNELREREEICRRQHGSEGSEREMEKPLEYRFYFPILSKQWKVGWDLHEHNMQGSTGG